jgi:hypothetical protein
MLAAALLAVMDASPATLAEKSAGRGVGLALAAGIGRMLSPGVVRMPVVGSAEDAACASACSGTDMCRSGCHCCCGGCVYCESSDAACPCCLLIACSLLLAVSDDVCPWNSCMAESSNALHNAQMHIGQHATLLASVTRILRSSHKQPVGHERKAPHTSASQRQEAWSLAVQWHAGLPAMVASSDVAWHPRLQPSVAIMLAASSTDVSCCMLPSKCTGWTCP